MKTITTNDIIGAVATFNSDPYMVEDEDLAQEIVNEINAHGIVMLDDEDEIEDALMKLDSPDYDCWIYRAGGCIFATREELK